MSEPATLAVGLMSGTSLDGIDAALVRFRGPTHCDLLHFVTRPYDSQEQSAILDGINGPSSDLARLHPAESLERGSGRNAPRRIQVRASDLGSSRCTPDHRHEPPLVSWQLGEPAVLAERFGVRVVSNARATWPRGQGAPLVPSPTCCCSAIRNIPGPAQHRGMANLTYVPAVPWKKVHSRSIPGREWPGGYWRGRRTREPIR